MYLQKLLDIFKKNNKADPFICIQDLVENGLSLDRFTTDNVAKPCRYEIALFLAAWCRLAGFEPEMYRDWLTNYCIDVLSKISSSSASQIRHSTKSSINYIHRSSVSFVCSCEDNIFKAHCSSNCPMYDEMKKIYLQNLEAEQKKIAIYQKKAESSQPTPESLSGKKKYEKQFTEAIGVIEERLRKGDTKKAIAIFLHEKGYKTRTGCKWKATTVSGIAIDKGWTPKRKKRGKGKSSPVQLKLF